MKSLLVGLILLLGSLSFAVGPDGVDYDFSPFPLKDGKVVGLEGMWGSDASMVSLEATDREYWGMPIFIYEEIDSSTNEVRRGVAWVAHSKEHYWLSIKEEDGSFEMKKLYFGYLTNVHNFSKNCGKYEQIPAIMILDGTDSLEVADRMSFHVESRSSICKF